MRLFLVLLLMEAALITSCAEQSLPEPQQRTEVEALEPEAGFFGAYDVPDPYHIRVAELLLGEHGYRTCQMVFMPSFRHERSVYLVDQEGEENTLVVAKELSPSLWGAMHEVLEHESTDGSDSGSWELYRDALARVDVQVVRKTAKLDQSTADLLDVVWNMMLMRVRYPTQVVSGKDGIRYHVASYTQSVGYRSGQMWNPPPETDASDLVEVAAALEAFGRSSETERSAAHKHLVALATALHEKLQ